MGGAAAAGAPHLHRERHGLLDAVGQHPCDRIYWIATLLRDPKIGELNLCSILVLWGIAVTPMPANGHSTLGAQRGCNIG